MNQVTVYPEQQTQRNSLAPQTVPINQCLIFESFGQYAHFLYQQEYSDSKLNKILKMNAVDQRNICMRQSILIYKDNQLLSTMEHIQNPIQLFCYSLYSNKLFIYKNEKIIGQVREGWSRIVECLLCCGSQHTCKNRSIQILDDKENLIFLIEGSCKPTIPLISETTQYNIYKGIMNEYIGVITQLVQFCNAFSCHCSCQTMYSPLLKRDFRVEFKNQSQLNEHYQMIFQGLIFLSKITWSYVC